MTEPSETLGRRENPNFDGAFPPPFREVRTTKKARFRDETNANCNPQQISYKESLVNSSQAMESGGEEGAADWNFEEGDVIKRNEGPIPSITFSARVHEKLSEPWKNSVVVKLLGQTIGYRTLCARLKIMWQTAMTYSVIDLENNYFLIRFRSAGDAVDALTKGPWIIIGHYLTVQPWMPFFDFTNTVIDQVTVWIRLPGLAVHLYDQRVLQKLGQLVGTVIKIDSNTASSTRGRFARLAVSISLNRPLVSQFELDGRIQKVEYEGLPVICFACGRYGHSSHTCQKPAIEKNSETIVQHPPDVQCQKNPFNQEVGQDKDGHIELFGPWMIATRRGRKPSNGKENLNASDRHREPFGFGASRVQVLAEDIHGNKTTEHEPLTDISSTSRQPLTPILNPIFAFNNDPSTSIPTRRKKQSKPGVMKQQSRKPSMFMNTTRSPSQSKTPFTSEMNFSPLSHAKPNSNSRPLMQFGHPNPPAAPVTTTLDPTSHTVVACPSQSHVSGDGRDMVTDHRDRQEPDPHQLADPPDNHGNVHTTALATSCLLPAIPMSGVDEVGMSDDEGQMVHETPLAMMGLTDG